MDRQLVLPGDGRRLPRPIRGRRRSWPAATLADLDLTVAVGVEFTDDVEEAGRRHAARLRVHLRRHGIGRRTNFYNDAFARQGYGDDVPRVQRLWLAGGGRGRGGRVPIEHRSQAPTSSDAGDRVKERLRLYRAAGITTLQGQLAGDVRARLDSSPC